MLQLSIADYATVNVMRISLHEYYIKLEPPQRLAMIEVRRLIDGFFFKVIHESGHESNDEAETVVLPESPEALQWIAELQRTSRAIPPEEVKGKQFPVVEKIDVRQLPQQYRLIPPGLPREFKFAVGEDFRVFVIGQEMVEAVVTAS
jgi:hypothetical protein